LELAEVVGRETHQQQVALALLVVLHSLACTFMHTAEGVAEEHQLPTEPAVAAAVLLGSEPIRAVLPFPVACQPTQVSAKVAIQTTWSLVVVVRLLTTLASLFMVAAVAQVKFLLPAVEQVVGLLLVGLAEALELQLEPVVPGAQTLTRLAVAGLVAYLERLGLLDHREQQW
jgi:hypothetical protein